jgi:uncharacterized protein YfcZ (UPF0381/DUF406 family)
MSKRTRRWKKNRGKGRNYYCSAPRVRKCNFAAIGTVVDDENCIARNVSRMHSGEVVIEMCTRHAVHMDGR